MTIAFESLLDAAEAIVKERLARYVIAEKGDSPGHPFRGNQWTRGTSTGNKISRSRIDRGEGAFRHYAEDDDAEVDQTLGANHKEWERSLSSKEKAAFRDYTTNEYHAINGSLRGGLDPTKPPPSNLKNKISEIDRAIAKSPGLPEDTMLYRGINEKNLHEQVKSGNLKKGNTLTDRGLMSTSPQIKETEVFIDGDHPVLYKIRAEKGSRGAYLGHKSINPANVDEAEVLLPRNVSLVVVGASMRGNVAEVELAYLAD